MPDLNTLSDVLAALFHGFEHVAVPFQRLDFDPGTGHDERTPRNWRRTGQDYTTPTNPVRVVELYANVDDPCVIVRICEQHPMRPKTAGRFLAAYGIAWGDLVQAFINHAPEVYAPPVPPTTPRPPDTVTTAQAHILNA